MAFCSLLYNLTKSAVLQQCAVGLEIFELPPMELA